MAAGLTIIGNPLYRSTDNKKPMINIFSDTPTYKNWPRDCSLEYLYIIKLNRSAMNKFGEEITIWLCTADINHKWIDSQSIRLYSLDELTMFKLTYGDLIV